MRLSSRPALRLFLLGALSSSAIAQSSGQVAQEFEGLHFRSIGAATMSGCVADVAVYEANPAIYYLGTTHGGKTWKQVLTLDDDTGANDLTVSLSEPDVMYASSYQRRCTTCCMNGGGPGSAIWRRLKANLPTVRVDELTIHPRDNALLVATHGRALWILDHLEPIQEYASIRDATAKLVTPDFTLQWKYKDDRNDESWGHQFFTGENPPSEAVLPLFLKVPPDNPRLRIAYGSGRVVRELAIPASRNVTGLRTMCWDQRVESIDPLPVRRTGGPGGPGEPDSRQRLIPGLHEFHQQFDCVRARFGVPAGAGGGFGGGAAAQAANVLGRVGMLKAQLQGIWELPTAGTMRQVSQSRAELTTAMAEGARSWGGPGG